MPLTEGRTTRLALMLVALGVCVALAGCTPADGWTDLLVWMQDTQRELHRGLSGAMRAVARTGAAAGWTLVGLSLAYGVFHAAGPGHGKAVIATYLATQEGQLRRGIALSVLSSLVQGVVAIVVVEAALGIFGMSMRRAQLVSTEFENLSFALVALVGLMLAWSNARRLWRQRREAKAAHGNAAASLQGGAAPSLFTGGGAWQALCQDCGVRHGPGVEHLQHPVSRRNLVAIVLAIGIRPCSGAVLVLLVAHALHLRWAGIAAVAAMSVGTAATVAVLATLSVYARMLSLRILVARPGLHRRGALLVGAAGLAGGLLICALGVLLLGSSLSAPTHPLF